MSRSKHDYPALEKLFIQTDPSVSIRSFSLEHDVPFSAMAAQARKPDSAGQTWYTKREAFHAKATEKAIEKAGDAYAKKITEIRMDALDMIHAAILKMGYDMQDHEVVRKKADGTTYTETIPGQVVTPDHFAKMIDKLLLLTGQPTGITEERKIVDSFDGLPPEFARVVAEVARERAAQSRPVERPRLPGAGIPRTN